MVTLALWLNAGPLTHYVILRDDLPRGALVAQCIHAAGESVTAPVPDDTYAVALAAKSEADLLRLADRLAAAGIPHKLIREPDPPFFGQAVALGIPPMDRRLLKPFLSSYGLIKEKNHV